MFHFSVIVPTCDRPSLLSRAVASVKSQSLPGVELIVVNDGRQITGPPAATMIETGGYRGHVVARNMAIAAARGDYIAFLDDDDYWIDGSHLARAAEQLSKASGLYHAAGLMTFDIGSPPVLFDKTADAASLAKDNTILVSTVCYPRALHASLGTFDETLTYYADWDWYLRVARAGIPIFHSAIAAAEILQHTGNMSGICARGARRQGLDALSAKHGLGNLPLKTHLSLVSENPGV
ncbi:MAG: glycosyltransferase family 2 protein [Rhizobiales bacterium]|nr:glycosyltransferase family 2 protein [Hyphomicrobiales bacterium]